MDGGTPAVPRRRGGQSLVEFAALTPVLMLLVFGLLDLGRAAYFQAESADAARDAARVFSAAGPTNLGPGYAAICTEVTNDLANFAQVSCSQVQEAPPYVLGQGDVPAAPEAGSALALIYCGDAADCQNPAVPRADLCDSTDVPAAHTCGSVTVYYGFGILTPLVRSLFGGEFIFTNRASFVSSW
jgi:Flp pilus assembly protein TadG